MWIVGWHGAHGEEFRESLVDVVALWKLKPTDVHGIIVGGASCDLLPTLSAGPWGDTVGRAHKHSLQRCTAEWCDEEMWG